MMVFNCSFSVLRIVYCSVAQCLRLALLSLFVSSQQKLPARSDLSEQANSPSGRCALSRDTGDYREIVHQAVSKSIRAKSLVQRNSYDLVATSAGLDGSMSWLSPVRNLPQAWIHVPAFVCYVVLRMQRPCERPISRPRNSNVEAIRGFRST